MRLQAIFRRVGRLAGKPSARTRRKALAAATAPSPADTGAVPLRPFCRYDADSGQGDRRVRLKRDNLDGAEIEVEPTTAAVGAPLRGRNVLAGPLSYYLSRGEITKPEFLAGERLAEDFHRALGRYGAKARDYEPRVRGSGPPTDWSDGQSDAWHRYLKALARVPMVQEYVVVEVACYGASASVVEAGIRKRGVYWPKHYAKRALRDGLIELAVFYRLLDRQEARRLMLGQDHADAPGGPAANPQTSRAS